MKHVALWGPTSSGKTVWLAQIYIRIQSLKTDWKIFVASKETQTFIEGMRELVVTKREFPLGTAQGLVQKIGYEFEHPAYPERHLLFTEDRAGLVSETLNEAELGAFTNADGLILLLDTQRKNFVNEVQCALERFYRSAVETGKRKDNRPVAFCLSKADLLIRTVQDLEYALAQPDAFVREQLDAELLGWIRQFCGERYAFFPVSSVGVRLDFGLVRSAVFYDERLRLRLTGDGVPIHLLTPYEWLFKELEQQK